MDGRELLSSLQDKLTPDEKEYLAAHRLQDILADETKLCDDPAMARSICKRVMYDQIIQAIQLTKKCPGVLTSVMYLSTYEYMAQALRGCTRACRTKLCASAVDFLPQETGKPLAFVLYRGGAPLCFRDADGLWYGPTRRIKVRQPPTRPGYYELRTRGEESELAISYRAAEACFTNNITNYEDWPALRHKQTKAGAKVSQRIAHEHTAALTRNIQELEKELTEDDKRLITSWRLDDYLSAVVSSQQGNTAKHRYGVYRRIALQLISATSLLSNRTPGLVTTYLWLYITAKINHLEAKQLPVGKHAGFRAGVSSYANLFREPGTKLRFCLRYKGEPVLFLGDDHQWCTVMRRIEPGVYALGVGYQVYIGSISRTMFLSKRVVDLCYRHKHDEYTTWKEIKKGGCLDELD